MQDKDLDAIVFLTEHGDELGLEGDFHVRELLSLLNSNPKASSDSTSKQMSMALRQHVVMNSYRHSNVPYDLRVAQQLFEQAEPDIQAYLRRLPPKIQDDIFGDTVVDNAFLHRAYVGMVEVLIAETQQNISHYQRKIEESGDLLETDLLEAHRLHRQMEAAGYSLSPLQDRPWREIIPEFLEVEEARLPALRLYRQELMQGLDKGEYVLRLPAVRGV